MSIAKIWNHDELSSEFTFVWKIKSINHCMIKKGEKLESPSFSVQDKGEWQLLFYPHGNLTLLAECAIRLTDRSRFQGTIPCRFCVCDSKQKLLFSENKELDFTNSYTHCMARFQREIFEELQDDPVVLHCHMWEKAPDLIENPVHYIAETSVNQRKSIFHWKIKDFSSLQFGEERMYSSLKFLSTKNNYTTIHMTLKLFLSGKNINDAFIQLRLYFEGLLEPACYRATCALNVMEGNKRTRKQIRNEYWLGSVLNVVKIPLFKRRELMAGGLPDDTLTLQGEVILSEGSNSEFIRYLAYDDDDDERHDIRQVFTHSRVCSVYGLRTIEAVNAAETSFVPTVAEVLPSLPSSGLSADLRQLFNGKGPLSDFELIVAGRSFPVHQILLASRSVVFRAMFTCDMLETAKRSLELSDIDAGTAERMLLYIYTDEEPPMDLGLESLVDLYSAADKYELSGLKLICGKRLVQDLDLANAPRVLQISDRHSDHYLKSEVLEFFVSNGRVAIESENWKKLEQDDPKLANEVLHKIIYENNQTILKITPEIVTNPKKRGRRARN